MGVTEKLVERQETEGVYKREIVKLDHSLEWGASGFSTRSTVICCVVWFRTNKMMIFDFYQ